MVRSDYQDTAALQRALVAVAQVGLVAVGTGQACWLTPAGLQGVTRPMPFPPTFTSGPRLPRPRLQRHLQPLLLRLQAGELSSRPLTSHAPCVHTPVFPCELDWTGRWTDGLTDQTSLMKPH